MSIERSVLRMVQHLASSHHENVGVPFDPAATPFHPPRGRYSTVHYGMMFPNLPAPLNFLDVIAVIGQPRVNLWRNDHLIRTSASDCASLLIGSAVTFPGQFRGYSVRDDLDLALEGSPLRFGDEFALTGRYPDFAASYRSSEFRFDLDVRATDRIAHFAKLRGNLYDHWSLLCEYTGRIVAHGETYEVAGLSTLEYARGVAVPLPFTFFSYHIINIDARTQVLMVEVLGPAGLPIQRAVYLRGLDERSGMYGNGFRFDIDEFESEARVTPNGHAMRLGTHFGWCVDDVDGSELISVDGTANGDYVFGMAGGYAGSYRYTGRFRGEPISGTGYIEVIGNHRPAQRTREARASVSV